MNKNLIIMSSLIALSTSIHCNGSFGGGFATGAILGTGITLAATSNSRNSNRDPYYEVDRMKARQEAEEIRHETRLRREEDRKRRRLEQEEAREERRHEHQKKENKKHTRERRSEESVEQSVKKIEVTKKTHTTSKPVVAKHTSKKSTHEHEIELKKLQLELKQLELDQALAA